MILRPSNAARWSECAGSLALQTLYPDDEESPHAREGTAAHFWVTEALEGRVLPPGAVAPNGHPIDMEMIECGQIYLDDVYGRMATAAPSAALGVEQKLSAHGLIHPLCEGTSDTYLIDLAQHRLIVWDYKYGHRDVDPFRNKQGLCYVATILERYELTLQDVKGWEIIICIVQPRNFRAEPVREWKMLGRQAWDAIEQLARAAERAAAPNALCTTSEHCRDCSAAHACEASLSIGGVVMDIAASSVPVDMDARQLGVYLRYLTAASKRLEALKDSLEEVALSKIRTGHQVPYWTIGHGDARERWEVPATEVIAMGEMLGVQLAKPVEPITPAQARKLGVDPTVISAYSKKPQGTAKLVPMDETAAAKAFS